jgi:hypothetical protein
MTPSEQTFLYRVDVVDQQTMESTGVAVLATSDIEAFEAIRDEYPRGRFTVVDRATGKEVNLDSRP